ncbi:unnamed protein product [Notodromas monacha]|uniref:Uncharacterized protein n=1 Tax=Notodromas monacha TaxID=399045 RepID=A0A7R9BRZ4_9CRUS|nr:unnamed protein product [Notodromas monacha]CAG0919219.1 unnamed protein product [Notodromas monacha]
MIAKCKWFCGFLALVMLLVCFPSVLRTFQVPENSSSISIVKDTNDNVDQFDCDPSIIRESLVKLRGNFSLSTGFRKAEKKFRCVESVTFCTHGDASYLENLAVLVMRWRGPVSLSVFASQPFLKKTVSAIDWWRNCAATEEIRNEIRANVTFHLITNASLDELRSAIEEKAINDCLINSEAVAVKKDETVTFYPINIARNVATEEATTKYILNADIELFPSVGFIRQFLNLISHRRNRRHEVFVLPIFEVAASVPAPSVKKELIDLYLRRKAVSFHKFICEWCHRIPELDVWMLVSGASAVMEVFSVVKRRGSQRFWEPIYVATRREPVYDERLGWSGGSDKMMQMFELCAEDYNFNILSNAFLVHKPGIKRRMPDKRIAGASDNNSILVKALIREELLRKYGNDTGCEIVV